MAMWGICRPHFEHQALSEPFFVPESEVGGRHKTSRPHSLFSRNVLANGPEQGQHYFRRVDRKLSDLEVWLGSACWSVEVWTG